MRTMNLFLSSLTIPFSIMAGMPANADYVPNGNCEVAVDGFQLFSGPCFVQETKEDILLNSLEIVQPVSSDGQTDAIPARRLQIWIDEDGLVYYVGYHKDEMSRFKDIFRGEDENRLALIDGCIKSEGIDACFSVSDGAVENTESAFSSAPNSVRKSFQKFMLDNGYYGGTIDGQWGPMMADGVSFLSDVIDVSASLGWKKHDVRSVSGMTGFMLEVHSEGAPPVMTVYSFCDNLDGNLLDAKSLLTSVELDTVSQKYLEVADKWCSKLFVEGD
jgi:hypothetical protein